MTALARTLAVGDWMSVYTPFHPAVVAQFKAMPGCTWDQTAGAWSGPAEAVQEVLATLERAKIIIRSDEVIAPPFRPVLADAHGLYSYQADGVRFMLDSLQRNGSALLADDMGLGKSAQTVRAITSLMVGPVLVLSPAVVVPHWAEQLRQWGGLESDRLGRKLRKAEGEGRLTSFGAGVLTCSYDTFRSLWNAKDKSRRPPRTTVLVLDELHYLANDRSQRSKAVREYVRECRKAAAEANAPFYVIGLTGTPISTRPNDLWNQLDILFPRRFGNKFKFEQRYCEGKWVEIKGLEKPVWDASGQSNLEELGRRLQKLSLRRVKGDVLELPERQRIVLPVEMPAAARKGLVAAARALSFDRDVGKALSAIEEYKIEAAVELANTLIAQGRKPLVFTLRRDTAHQIAKELGAVCVTGEDDVLRRRELLAGARVGVATIYSVTTGINLTEFDAVIFVGLDWRPSTHLQAEARIHRIGQDRDVLFYYLVGMGTVDESVRSLVVERLDTFQTVVGNAPDEAKMAATLRGNKTEKELLDEILASVLGS